MHNIHGTRHGTGRNIHHLHKMAIGESADYKAPVVANHLRIGRTCVFHDKFCLLRQDTVSGNMVDVDVIPDEVHSMSYSSIVIKRASIPPFFYGKHSFRESGGAARIVL